jgi:8-oxo-dGTP diphosphatase
MQKVTAAVIEKEGRVLIARRRADDRFGGLWEFPGGKLEPGEEPRDGLRRELREELGVETSIGPFLGSFPYSSPGLSIELLAFRVSIDGGDPSRLDHDEILWVLPAALTDYAFTEPDRPLAGILAQGGEA